MPIDLYYWSPCLNKVGTYKSTINSAISLSKYSKGKFNVKIINACGEWNLLKKKFAENKIDVIDLNFNYFKFLPKNGYIKSRFSSIVIIILSFIPLAKLMIKKKNLILLLYTC